MDNVQVIHLDVIKKNLDINVLEKIIEEGFVSYSEGRVITPPVGELVFDDPPGDTHIKYGYIKKDTHFVIKIASGFYENVKYNLPSGSGLMLVFSQKTGFLENILLDEGYLTNVRTALAGKIAAKYLAPSKIDKIGVFGTGEMAKMQVTYLEDLVDCKDILVWGRSETSLMKYKSIMSENGYNVEITQNQEDIAKSCNLIIMTTPSKEPLLQSIDKNKGIHITAIGSDTHDKQELNTSIFKDADIVATDSLEQCKHRGEIPHAVRDKFLDYKTIIELGAIIKTGNKYRKNEDQITIADLTGMAVQDIQIAKAVCQTLKK